MKTKSHSFLFTEAEVQQFVRLSGDQSPIYYSMAAAQSYGYEAIPIPPTMPMIVYKQIETPWKLKDPVIHRKQQCGYHQVMYIDQPYTGFITLTNQIQRHNQTFINQVLEIYDKNRALCFTGTSHLIAGDLTEND
jgi:hypothetical protein